MSRGIHPLLITDAAGRALRGLPERVSGCTRPGCEIKGPQLRKAFEHGAENTGLLLTLLVTDKPALFPSQAASAWAVSDEGGFSGL